MTCTISRFGLAVALVAGLAGHSHAAFIPYVVSLNGPSESPPNASPGNGFAEVDFDTTANTLRVQVSFTGLLGTTTAAHIHAATPTPGTGTAIVATTTPKFLNFPTGVTAGTYDSGLLDLTSSTSYNPAFITASGGTVAGAEAALIASAAAGTSYLNIHTSVVPGGEIRGFLEPVPEPSSFVLTALAAPLGLGYWLRRRVRAAA